MDLLHSLQGRDLGHLRIIADLWGIELSAPDARVGVQRLAPAMLARGALQPVLDRLPQEARQALDGLLQSDGQMPWALFTRRCGEVREMGPARRDRERPHLHPVSPAEALWYRGLVGRAFLDTPAGPEEHAFIPDDLLALIPGPQRGEGAPLGRPATQAERQHPVPASDRILDDATTLLAAQRLGLPGEVLALHWPSGSSASLTPGLLRMLFSAAGLLDAAGLPQPEPARLFLEAGRGEALARLAGAWLRSPDFNELRLLPGLSAEGDWTNDPLRARQAVVGFVMAAPVEVWWSLPAFVSAVRQAHPDFQRQAGDYDSWFLREEASGEFLRGFAHWDEVDGALLRYIITGPLHWLGILDLAAPADGAPPSAFRRSRWSASLVGGRAPEGMAEENERITLRSDARIYVPRLAPRAARYQIARFCAWESGRADVYQYRLSPSALERARQQGLRTGQMLALLRRHAASLPPSLLKALERWDEHGSEARLEQVTILRLSSPELLQSLRASRAARFLGDPLGPTVVVVRPGMGEKVLAVLAEMGYLGEAELL